MRFPSGKTGTRNAYAHLIGSRIAALTRSMRRDDADGKNLEMWIDVPLLHSERCRHGGAVRHGRSHVIKVELAVTMLRYGFLRHLRLVWLW